MTSGTNLARYRQDRPLPSAGAAVRDLGPGVASAAEIAGVAALRRLRPRTWHQDLKRLSSAPPRTKSATVAEVLSSRINVGAFPRHADDFSRIKRPRACARRVVELVGGLPIQKLNSERRLKQLHLDLVSHGAAASTANRTVALARKVVRAWCRHVGAAPRLHPRRRRENRRIGRRAGRPVPGPQQIGELLAALPDHHRVALALAAGAGLIESEILGLRFEDLKPSDHAVVVATGGIRGRAGQRCFRYEYVAGWAWELLLATFEPSIRRGISGPIFRHRSDPRRSRSSFGPLIRKVSIETFGRGAPVVTLGAARRLWQRVQIDAGLPSAQSRQSWSLDEIPRGDSVGLPAWAAEAEEVASQWRELCTPPVDLRERRLSVPRRKPKGCGRLTPELSPRSRGATTELPDSCRARPLEPPSPPTPPRGGARGSRAAAGAPTRRSDLPHRGGPATRDDSFSVEELAEAVARRIQGPSLGLAGGTQPKPAPRDPNQARAEEERQRAVLRRLDLLAAEVARAGQKRGGEDLVLAVLAGAAGGFAAQNGDDLAARVRETLEALGAPTVELDQLIGFQGPGPGAPGHRTRPGWPPRR